MYGNLGAFVLCSYFFIRFCDPNNKKPASFEAGFLIEIKSTLIATFRRYIDHHPVTVEPLLYRPVFSIERIQANLR